MQRFDTDCGIRPLGNGEGAWFGFRLRGFAERRREEGLIRAMAAEVARAMEPRSRRSDAA